MIEVPDVELPVVVTVERPTHRVHPRLPGEFFPLRLLFPRPLAVISRPRLARLEFEVVSNQRKPVFAGHDAKGVPFQPLGSHASLTRVFALADVDFQGGAACFGDDLQPGSGDFFQVGLQFLGAEFSGTRRILRDDDLRVWLAIFDEERLSKRNRRECKGQDEQQMFGHEFVRVSTRKWPQYFGKISGVGKRSSWVAL